MRPARDVHLFMSDGVMGLLLARSVALSRLANAPGSSSRLQNNEAEKAAYLLLTTDRMMG